MRLLILGGNRFIGAELVMCAVAQGHDVTVLSLDRPAHNAATWLRADRETDLSPVLAGRAFDSVIDNIAFRAQHVTRLLDSLRGKAARYVLTSSVDIYCNRTAIRCDELRDERLAPSDHSGSLPPWEAYLRGKRACEVALRSTEYLETVVVRPAVVIGARDNIMCPPGGVASRSLFFPVRIADRGPILLRHTDTRLHQLAYVGDVADALLLAATHPLAAGQVLNVVGDEVWTNESLVCSLSTSVGLKTTVVRVSASQLEATGLAAYRTPYSHSVVHSWSLFSNRRLKLLGWRPSPAAKWGPALFCFDDVLVRRTAGQRQRELSLARSILASIPAGTRSRICGMFRGVHRGISPVGIGTHRGPESRDTDLAYLGAIQHAVRRGINVIDTAINYREMRSERVVGEAIEMLLRQGFHRHSLCIVTKGGFIPASLLSSSVLSDLEREHKHSISAEYISLSLEQSLINMRLHSLDIYLLHNPEASLLHLGRDRFYEHLIKTFAMLEQRVREGVIGQYGIATWEGLRTLAGHDRHIDLSRVIVCSELAAGGKSHFSVIELPLNLKDREAGKVLSQKVGNRAVSTLDFAAANGLLVLTSRSVMAGAAEAHKSLQFIRSHPQVTCALVGMRQLRHVDEAVAIMELNGSVARDTAHER